RDSRLLEKVFVQQRGGGGFLVDDEGVVESTDRRRPAIVHRSSRSAAAACVIGSVFAGQAIADDYARSLVAARHYVRATDMDDPDLFRRRLPPDDESE